jgi:hypothetical protein
MRTTSILLLHTARLPIRIALHAAYCPCTSLAFYLCTSPARPRHCADTTFTRPSG